MQSSSSDPGLAIVGDLSKWIVATIAICVVIAAFLLAGAFLLFTSITGR
jgi:hypothetical protein